MSHAFNVVAALGLGVIASACSAPAGNDDAVGASSEAIRCTGTWVCDIGLGGKLICTCEHDTPPPDGGTFDAGPPPVAAAPAASLVAMGRASAYSVETLFGPLAWGDNYYGELASGAIGGPDPNPASIQGLPAFPINLATMIAAGYESACAVARDSSVWCWGGGALGSENSGGAPAPTAVQVLYEGAPLSQVTQLAAGGEYACVVASGDVICWGDLAGDGVVAAPFKVEAGFAIAQVAVGAHHACLLRASDGAVYCWGTNDLGQLGLGAVASGAGSPLQVPGIFATNVFAGQGSTCAELAVGGTYSCWGEDEYGELGDGAEGANIFVPEAVPALTGASSLSFGTQYSCGIFGTQVRCWGQGQFGDLGTGASGTVTQLTPTAIPSFDAVQVAAGTFTTCAHRNDGSVWCWGGNWDGQCGPAPGSQLNTPQLSLAAR